MVSRTSPRSSSLDYPNPWEYLRVTYVAIRRECARTVAPFGLLYSEYRVLTMCRATEVTPGAIARDLGVTPAAATGIVARLARRGWVRKRPHPTDGRARRVELTARGRRLEARVRRAWIGRLTRLGTDLSPADLGRLGQSLAALARVLRERDARRTPRK